MKHVRLCWTLLLLSLPAPLAAAQEGQGDIAEGVGVEGTAAERGLYIEIPSQERLLHRKPMGDYTVTVLGERLIGNAYFLFNITHPEGAIGPDSRVVATLELLPYDPYEGGQETPSGEVRETYLDEETSGVVPGESDPEASVQPANVTRYEARFDAEQGRFVVDELTLEEGTYAVDVRIEGPLGRGEGSFFLYVYPRKPGVGLAFRLANLAAAPLVLAVLLLVAGRRGWRLERSGVGANLKGARREGQAG